MPEVKKIAEMILLSRTQREIQQICRASPKTIVDVRKKIEKGDKSSSEIQRMNEEELRAWIFPAQPRKLREHVCMPVDLEDFTLTILQGKTIKEAWGKYCAKASAAGHRPLKYSAYCNEVKKTGDRDLLREAQHLKAGMFAFVKSEHTIKVGGKQYPICFGIFPLSQMVVVVPCLSTVNDALQDIIQYIGGTPPFIYFPKAMAGVKESTSDMLSYYNMRVISFDINGADKAAKDADRFFGIMLADKEYTSKKEVLDQFAKVQDIYNERLCYSVLKSREEFFEELEQKELTPLPSTRYEKVEEKHAKIQYDYHVSYQKVRYSVPPEAYEESTDVILMISKSRITIISEEGELLAEHPHLSDTKVRYSTLPEHIRSSDELSKLSWNAARFKCWAKKFSDDTERIVANIIDSFSIEQQAYRQCYYLLNLGDKMKKVGRLDEFIAACREEKDTSGSRSYYVIKKRLDKE